MHFETEKLSDQVVRIHASLKKEDYLSEYKKKIKDIRTKGSFKGFRKGKTPASFVEKMYGSSTLMEIVNDKMIRGLYDYLKDEDIQHIFDPMLSDNEQKLEIEHTDMKDYETSYDVALKPQFDISGLDDEYEAYLVEVDTETIDKEIDHIRNRMGKQVESDDGIEADHMLEVTVYQIDENGKPLDGGIENSTKLYLTDAGDAFKDAVLGQKVGHVMQVDPYQIEKSLDTKMTNRYLLNTDSEEVVEGQFELVINTVFKREKADINQEFFDGYTGVAGEITSEEQLRERIKEHLQKFYDEQTDNLLKNAIGKKLKSTTTMTLPTDFIEKWSEARFSGDEQEKPTMEAIEEDVRWSLIVEKLVNKYNIEPKQEDILAKVKSNLSKIAAQYGIPPTQLDAMAQNFLSNQESVAKTYREVESEMLFNHLAEDIKTTSKSISIDEYNTLVQEFKQQ